MKTGQEKDLDELIEDSRRLQAELTKTVVRLDVFVDQLAAQVAKLRIVTGSDSE